MTRHNPQNYPDDFVFLRCGMSAAVVNCCFFLRSETMIAPCQCRRYFWCPPYLLFLVNSTTPLSSFQKNI